MRRILTVVVAVVCSLSPWALPAYPAWAGVTTRVSVSSSGEQGYGTFSNYPSISGDGRYVAFWSNSSNLVAGDTNSTYDVFVHDRQAHQTERVSLSSSGAQANLDSYSLSISADGRYVAFESNASNLVEGDTFGYRDIFVHDLQTGETARVSVSTVGGEAGKPSFRPSISADGRYVAFDSQASNLVPGHSGLNYDVFIHDRQEGETAIVSVAQGGGLANSNSSGPSISGEGRYVAFESSASNLIAGDTNGLPDIFVYDRQNGQTTRVSLSSAGDQANNWSTDATISSDGRYVAFMSRASNLVSNDTNGCFDVFLHDRQTGQTIRASVSSVGQQATGSDSSRPSISSDGRYVSFYSAASNLVQGDTNETGDVFIYDRQTGQTTRASVSSSGAEANGYSDSPSLSADGRYIAFYSTATNLVSGDTNGKSDVFVRDSGATGTSPPPGSGPGYTPPGGAGCDIRNPYDGYSVVRRAKGQLHSHYFNDTPYVHGFGSCTPAALVALYGLFGYDFLCITEHYHCTTATTWPGAFSLNYCEEVTVDGKHVLALGIDQSGCGAPSSGPGGDEGRYFPWDWHAKDNGLCEVEQYDCSTLEKRIHKVHDWGGMAVIAHPRLSGISSGEILGSYPDAVSVYNAATFSGALDTWDAALTSGSNVPTSGYRMPLFAITEDDFTPVVGAQGFARTWVMAELDTGAISRDSIMRALKLGRFWSYKAPYACAGTGPVLRLTTSFNGGGKPIIRVVSTEPVDGFTFVRRKAHVGRSDFHAGAGTSAEYVCDGDEVYVRVEVKKGSIMAYSQPVGIHWNWTSGGSMSEASIPKENKLAGTPTDLVLTCAQPEQLPEKMPALGYIGRAYFASTSSGVYPSGATLTLSYEGQDVTPYGTSNLAIYRWDSAESNWTKLTSTVDIGNALVTALLTQAGLYTISAQVIGDATAPTVTIHTPADGATLTGPGVIGVQAYDNVGVQTVSFYLGDQCIGTDSTGWDGYTCEYDFGKKSAGQYVLKVTAEDVSGNTGEAQVTVNITSSGVTPLVSITYPASGGTLEGNATVTGTCSDNSLVAGVFIKIDGMAVGEATVSGGTWTYDLDTSQLANGPHTLSAEVMDDDQNTSEQSVSVIVADATLASAAEAKSLADGERARLAGRVVTLGNPGHQGAFYVEELNRIIGLRVLGDEIPAQGDMVSISGLMSTVEGERAIVGADVAHISSSNALPLPLGLWNLRLGGAANQYSPGVTGGFGLQNIGLLVRIWGRVMHIGEGYLYIDDGSALRDGTNTGPQENVGVRVICNPTGYTAGQFLSVTGISSCFETPEGRVARRVITRGPLDIRLFVEP